MKKRSRSRRVRLEANPGDDPRERARLEALLCYEREAWSKGYSLLAGVDEAGRGPLAGPVVAAAVILRREAFLPGLDDSKVLTPSKRDRLYDMIRREAVAVGIGIVGEQVIDAANILRATRVAMADAVRNMEVAPDCLLIDALALPDLAIAQKPIIHGDALSLSIAAASVIAKVTRDRIMEDLHKQYPVYNFSRHKGYGTAEHLERIRLHGPSPVHRLSFRGVKEWVPGD